jgi:glycosyltransferase involved in cell wall biosynthesis
MRIAMVVPGGVDRSGEVRVIPALLWLLKRLAEEHDLQVFSLYQGDTAAEWDLLGAHITNIGRHHTRRRGISAIYQRHRLLPFDVVHAIWSGTCGAIALAAALLIRRACLIHVAGGELVAIPDIGYGGMQSWRGRLREKWVLQRATAVTAASRPIIDSLAALGITARRIPLGVDLVSWPPRPPVRRAHDRPARLIHVASLNRVKDQPTLLRALAALAARGVAFGMVIVGEDTLGGEIQRLAAQLNLSDRIEFLGFVSHENLRPLIHEADLLVMTSRHEAGPLVVLEAAVAGIPTAGTLVGHIAEWAPQAAAGVAVGDYVQLAREIERLIGDENYRLKTAAAAQRRAILEDADQTARQFQQLYSEVTGRSPVTSEKVCTK